METLKQVRRAAKAVAACALLLPLGLTAQSSQPASDPQTSQSEQDPSGRVARLNYFGGSVSLQPAGVSEWVDAILNRPLATGDNVWVDENSRAELHVGSTALRLGEKTGITLLEVSDHAVQIRLAEGSLIVNVRHVDDEDAYEIDTPNVAFVVMQPGDYRVDVSPDDFRTDVTVWRGRGEATGGGSTYTIAANQVASFTGSDRLDYDAAQIGDNDAFDAWASEQDRREDDSDAGEYVSSDMTGTEDLGNYGNWSYVAEYGYVWRPAGLVPGWAPYRYGRWIWVSPWGWTWVANEPWGFAPFHYGRWAFAGNNWVWVPGPRIARPVYAPALVGWVGAGGASIRSSAPVGWFALAPGEVFVPSYKVSSVYVNRVNTTNTNVTETRVASVYKRAIAGSDTSNITFANRSVQGGITAVSRETFVNARPVGTNLVVVSERENMSSLASQTVVVEPSSLSRLGAGTSAHQPPAGVSGRAVVVLRMPSVAPSASGQGQGLVPQPSSPSLVRQLAPGQRVSLSLTPAKRVLHSDASATITEQGSSGSSEQTKPRVWEEQGTPDPEKTATKQPGSKATSSAKQRTQTPVKTTTPEPARTQAQSREKEEKPEYSSWHPQKAAANSRSSTQGHSSSSTAAPPPKK